MSATRTRRPLPALVFLLVLLIAAAVVWWRVLHSSGSSTGKTTAIVQPTFSLTCAPTPTTLPKAATIEVTVLNGNGTTGLAQKVSSQLKTSGFQTGAPGDAAANYVGSAQIRFGKKAVKQAQTLSYYLTNPTFLQDDRQSAAVDLVLGTKFTQLHSPAFAAIHIAKAQRACS